MSKQIERSIDLATEGKAAESEGGAGPTLEEMTRNRRKRTRK